MPVKNIYLFHPDDDSGSDDGGQGGGNGEQGSGSADSGSQEDKPDSQEGSGKDNKVLTDARKEAAKYRRERNELAKRVEALEAGQKTEVEKLSDKATTLAETNKELMATNRQLRVRTLAGSVGIADAKAAADAASLLDWETVTDPDSDAAIEEALRELVKDRPYLLGNVAGGGDGGEGGEHRASGSDMNQQIRSAFGVRA